MKKKMKTKAMAILMSLAVAFTMMPMMMETVHGADIVSNGQCGDNVNWELDSNGVLTISGTGAMYDYNNTNYRAPWYSTLRSDIKKIVIGDGITRIGSYEFEDCRNMKEVDIGDDVESIGRYGFYLCRALEIVALPESVKTVENNAFMLCESLISADTGDGVETIQDRCFDSCEKLEKVTIGKSCSAISVRAFKDTSALKEIDVSSDNRYYCSVDGILFNKEKTVLIRYPSGKTIGKYDIPEGIANIGARAFEDCTDLTEITIPGGVKTIGEKAFYNCEGLMKVIIPNSVETIGNHAFEFCDGLKEVTIGSGVKMLEDEVFSDCDTLKKIVLTNSIQLMDENAFDDTYNVESVVFHGTEKEWTDLVSGLIDTNLGAVQPVFHNSSNNKCDLVCNVKPTCTEAGDGYYICSICNGFFSNEAGEGPVATPFVVAVPPLGHKYGAWTKLNATQHQKVCQHYKSHVIKENHKWDAGKVTKKASAKATGVRTYTCTVCKATKTKTIPKLKPSAPKVSGTPLAKMAAGKTSLTIGWNKIQGAAGYDIFFAQCNHNGKKIATRNVKTIKGNKTFKWTKSGLKKGTAYKAYVRAYVYKNGKKTYVRNSPLMHAYTGNGTRNYTNAKSVTVNKTKVTLKKGKTFKIKAKVNKVNKKKKLMSKSHAPTLRYMTSNSKVATVSPSGKITAKGKGICNIYVYAHNGVSRQVKVTVK